MEEDGECVEIGSTPYPNALAAVHEGKENVTCHPAARDDRPNNKVAN